MEQNSRLEISSSYSDVVTQTLLENLHSSSHSFVGEKRKQQDREADDNLLLATVQNIIAL